jgi:LysM repeat protein
MSWKQTRNFNIFSMGRKKGWCLQNVRLGFGIQSGHFASAKADMEYQKTHGTFHTDNIPTNVAVPVYIDSLSQYEHVLVSDNGTYYSDGMHLTSLNGLKVFGWGECCDNQRVVEWQEDRKKSNDEIANEVIAGKWGAGQDRKNRLQSAGYDYNTVQAIVNQKLKPANEYYTVVKGDNLTIIAQRHGVSVNQIVSLNNLQNPNLIYPGQRLRIK